MSPITRRTLLLSGAAATAIAAGTTHTVPPAWAEDEFDVLAARWRDLVTGGELDLTHPDIRAGLQELDTRTAELLDTMVTSQERTQLWEDLPLEGPQEANLGVSYNQVTELATAWATTGSAVHADPGLAENLVAALRLLHDAGYRASGAPVGNWWFWEIGIPRQLADTCCLLGSALPPTDLADYLAAIRRFTPDPNFRGTGSSPETGANRTDKAVACAVRGILARDAAEVELARDALSDLAGDGRNSVFRYVTSGDGFYADGSFVQHGYLPYVGTYGTVALGGVSRMLALLGGSSYAVVDPDLAVVLDAPAKSFAPFVWNGLMMHTVRGRAVSRQQDPDWLNGFATVSALLLMAPGVDAAYARSYRAMARGWIENAPKPYLSHVGLPEIGRALEVLAEDSVVGRDEPDGHLHFGAQDRSVHRRPGWAFTVSTSSDRIGRYEWGNRENNHGWYQGDGMSYLYVGNDLTQFSDDFWPTVDPYRLPGTTTSLAPRASGEADGTGIPRATRAWAGGSVAMDRWGAIGMDHLNHDRSLSARLSWFCLDDRVVALGSDVTGSDGYPVETCVENRNLHEAGDPRFLIDGEEVLDGPGSETTLTPRWAHLDGVGGYLFGASSRVVAALEERSGSWREINSGGDTAGDDAVRTRRYLRLSLDHGTDPDASSYEYVLLPGATPEQTSRLATRPGHQVLANTAEVQAIRTTQRGHLVTMANAFAAAEVDGHRVSGACSMVLVRRGGDLTVALSDPSRAASLLRIELDVAGGLRVASADPGLEVSPGPGRVQITADLTAAAGGTRTVRLVRS